MLVERVFEESKIVKVAGGNWKVGIAQVAVMGDHVGNIPKCITHTCTCRHSTTRLQ